MNWKRDNTLTLADLREAIHGGKVRCAVIGCHRKATSIHHLDRNHSNHNPANLAPACKPCHDEEHGLSADMNDLKLLTREFYAIQDHRKALANRIRAYEHLGLTLTHATLGLQEIVALEAELKTHIEAMLRVNPFYNTWLRLIKGIGPLLSASLLAELGGPERFNTVGQLWAYCGLHVNPDGKAPRRNKGQQANWNSILQATLFKAVSCFIRCRGCLGRQLYDEYKAFYAQRDGPDPAWQPHKRAMRRVAKDFVRCLWLAWMQSRGKPVNRAHPKTRVFPGDWV